MPLFQPRGTDLAVIHRQLAELTPDAISTIAEVMRFCPDPKLRLAAAIKILEHVKGTPTSSVNVQTTPEEPTEVTPEALAALTDDELKQLVELKHKIDDRARLLAARSG